MQEQNPRRDFLKASLLTGAGIIASSIPTIAKPNTKKLRGPIWTPKDFSKIKEAPPEGLSRKQISQHLGLYNKYIKKFNEVKESEKKEGVSRLLLRKKGYVYGGAILHELYFQNMLLKNQSSIPTKELSESINNSFGSTDNLLDQFTNAAKASRGWAILGLNLIDGEFQIIGMDTHSEGSCLGFIHPLLIIDVYEHAYMIDMGTDKGRYIDIFLKSINWDIVSRRYAKAQEIISQCSPLYS